MIYFDITKSATVRHRSGLARMSERLRDELGGEARSASWTEIQKQARADDWFVTTELFSESERPGFRAFLENPPCRTAAVFADAIPLKYPHITWPQSVARHPNYLKLLAKFQRVWAISRASRDELVGYWQWLGLEAVPPIEVLALGSDLSGVARTTADVSTKKSGLLCVGILEPRKNQLFLLDVCERLWSSDLEFELHIVGRVNPHFGAPIVGRIKKLQKQFRGLRYHEAAKDEVLENLSSTVRATMFPTIAEGCGLPLLESLWHGVPCVCSNLPVLLENAQGGGCLTPDVNSMQSWTDALRSVLQDDSLHARLANEASTRVLPKWSASAQTLAQRLR